MSRWAIVLLAWACIGCDDRPAGQDAGPNASAAAASQAAPAMTATSTATAAAAASAVARPMPPRPFPIGSSGPVQPSDPPDKQMMAIQYTLAMVSPHPTDPLVVKDWVDATVKKLETAVRGLDKGKTPPNPARPAKGNRKLEVDMGKGCTDRTPGQLIQRAGSSLKEAYENGVLVVSCRDDKWECHQSTRDTSDVLCHAAPR